MNLELLRQAEAFVRAKWPAAKPVCGLVFGSGWGAVADAFEVNDAIPYTDIPGLGATGVVGHAGKLLWASSSGLETFVFQGRRHYYEGEGWTPIAIPIYLLKSFGAQFVFLTNAAGGINTDMKPGSLMILDDHINSMGSNPLIGPHLPVWGPRFPDQSRVYAEELRALLEEAADEIAIPIHRGVYLATSGPVYETPAEIRAYETLGADAVGMSTVPEAQLASASGMKVVALSCISNSAAGISEAPLSHEEVAATTARVMNDMKNLILQFWKLLASRKK